LRAALSEARSLPAAGPTRIERVGDRLILTPLAGGRGFGEQSWSTAVLRYAASVLIAFVAGYSAHSALSREGAQPAAPTAVSRPDTLQVALADAHLRNPGRSDLAKCMIAVFDSGSRR
jgi:hypothetical protein